VFFGGSRGVRAGATIFDRAGKARMSVDDGGQIYDMVEQESCVKSSGVGFCTPITFVGPEHSD
jgi:hypothetical protein